MTQTSEESKYPTAWHSTDALAGMECRQLSDDTYQLRSHSHVITIDTEGFGLWREDIEAFEKWQKDKGIKATPRDAEPHD